jgi:hypothetical protein
MIEKMKLFVKLEESPGMFLKILKLYPSNLFNPSCVPNHIKPFLSCRIQVTELCDRPSSIVR